MFGTPQKHLSRMLIAVAVLALGIASCNGQNGTPLLPTTNPGGGTHGGGSPPPSASPSATASPSASPTATPTPAPTPTHTPTPAPTPTHTPTPAPTPTPALACAASVVPGTYYTVVVNGNVSGSTFTMVNSNWVKASYTAGTPTPSPTATPTAGPTATPSPQPIFVYQGTYTVGGGVTATNGCAFLETTQGGEPLNGLAYNAINADTPIFNVPVNSMFVSNGTVTNFTLTNLTSTGGSGTFVLSDGSNGTLTLTSRTSVADRQALDALIHSHQH